MATKHLILGLRGATVAALLFLLMLVGLITTSAGVDSWARSGEISSNSADVALGHRPQPPPPPRVAAV